MKRVKPGFSPTATSASASLRRLDHEAGALLEAADLGRRVADRAAHLARELGGDFSLSRDEGIDRAGEQRRALGDPQRAPGGLGGACPLEGRLDLAPAGQRALEQDLAVDRGDHADSISHRFVQAWVDRRRR